MKNFLAAAILLISMSSANATETGFYNFVFTSDDPAADPFTVCFRIINQGPGKPFLEMGFVEPVTTGPFGQPGGNYNIVSPNSLTIYMGTSSLDATPQYQYLLTGLIGMDNFVNTRNARYTIGLATQPPPPMQRGGATRGSKPGGYSIVDTGSFSVSFVGSQNCG